MINKLKKLILKRLITFPGIVGITSMNFDESNQALEEKEFKKGILIERHTEKLIISVSLIGKHNMNNAVIVKEIYFAIKNILDQEKIKLFDLKIYIRGVN